MKRPLSRGGFSLTELLVVVAIILILVSLIFVVGERMYARTLQVQCQSRLEKIGNALQMYANEYAGQMPKPWDPYSGRLWFQTLVADERLEGPQILTCPVVGKPPAMAHGPGIAPKRRYCVDEYLRALYWLRHIQEETGQFPALECDKSWHQYPKVMTGFALMAYFGYGCTDRRPAEFAETVRKGVEFLCSSQGQYKSGEDKGKFKVRGAHIYGQGICLMALSEAVRTVEDPALRAQAQAAVQLGMDWLADEQPWHGCFTYNGPAIAEYDEDLVWYDDEGEEQVGKWVGTRADTSACGWAYQGVGAARLAGVNAPSEVMSKAQVFLDYMAQTDGKIGYRFWPLPDGSGTSDWLTHRHTSIGMLARLMLDESPGSSVVQSQLNYVTQDKDGVPVHIYNFTHPEGQYMKPGKATDRYQFYHTTRALRAIGGSHWTTWRDGDPGIVAHDQEWEGYPKWV
ncbi:MAG: prepilin-type N-terminal cleavage/methylation domain-containing protein, partial [Planctomycetota bacterium]